MADLFPAPENPQTSLKWPAPLAIYHLLATETDKDHPLTTGEITDRLADYGVSLNSKAVTGNLNKLKEAGLAEPARSAARVDPVTGWPLTKKDGSPIMVKKGWRRTVDPHEGPDFPPLSDDELAYLGHTLFESFELTQEERIQIWQKLRPLIGPRGDAYGESRPHRETLNSTFMPTLSVIHEAMDWRGPHGEIGSKLTFTMVRWDYRGQGDEISYEELVVDPLCVTHISEGSYLVAWEEGKEWPSHFRLDLIRAACIAGDYDEEQVDEDGEPAFKPVPADHEPFTLNEADEYVDSHPYLCEGKVVEVHFRLRDVESNHYRVRRMFRSALKNLYYNKFIDYDMLYGQVDVCEEGAFLWAVNQWPEVEILDPPSLRQRIAGYAQNLIQAYVTRADLQGKTLSEAEDTPLRRFISALASDRNYDRNSVLPLYDMGNHQAGNMVRIANLRKYLEAMRDIEPTIMLVGMAPGRKGTAKTGVPFTDEAHLYADPTTDFARAVRAGSFYRSSHRPEDIGSEQETSATTIWKGLADWDRPPLLWNICPFQCFEPAVRSDEGSMDVSDNGPAYTFTNRVPTTQEINFGQGYLEQLWSLFDIDLDQVWCLGEESQRAIFPDKPGYHLLHLPSSEGGVDECLAELAELKERYDQPLQEEDGD